MKIFKLVLLFVILNLLLTACTSTSDKGVTISKGFFAQNLELSNNI